MPNFETVNKAAKGSTETMQNLQIRHETMSSFVYKEQNLFIATETNHGFASILRNLLSFYETLRGLVHDARNHKTLSRIYQKFRRDTAKRCEIY